MSIEAETFGPSTDYTSLPRDEKQMAYELWKAAQPKVWKLEDRIAKHKAKRFANRHSQIRAAAKRRGVPKTGIRVPKLSMRRERQQERAKDAAVIVDTSMDTLSADLAAALNRAATPSLMVVA